MSDSEPEYADPEVYRKRVGFDHDWRDTWWRADFLSFLLDRWGLADVNTVLDVGCGAGHWGRTLLRVLPTGTRLSGIDREPSFAKLSTQKATELNLSARTEYRVGTAEAIPHPDASFDVVTCQTVLIHVADARIALAEMMRVLKPGGAILTAEPDNLASAASLLNVEPRLDPVDVLGILEFHSICERGKIALGEGDSSIGGRVPGLMAELGFVDIDVSVNENCPAVFPPYDRGHQPLYVGFELELSNADTSMFGGGTRGDSARLFEAGGGPAADFEAHWTRVETFLRGFEAAVANGTFHGARGQNFYLIMGRKPKE